MDGDRFIVSDGLSKGKTWATYERKPNGVLRRVVSRYLPARKTREEAEADLDCWLGRKVNLQPPKAAEPYVDTYFSRLQSKGHLLFPMS